jgi:fumarate reductase subunit D
MGIIEFYLAIGIVVAIFVLIGVTSDDFDETTEELFGITMSWTSKIFVVVLTILIWPYTLYRIIKMSATK